MVESGMKYTNRSVLYHACGVKCNRPYNNKIPETVERGSSGGCGGAGGVIVIVVVVVVTIGLGNRHVLKIHPIAALFEIKIYRRNSHHCQCEARWINVGSDINYRLSLCCRFLNAGLQSIASSHHRSLTSSLLLHILL